MITIYDIAKRANVSAMTVSRVINNSGRISEKTKAKVKKIMEELNYVPNSTARSLVKQETKTLSLLITDVTNPFYTTLARGAEDAAMQLGYKLLLGNSDENLVKEKEYVDIILSTRVDGVLFAPAGDGSLDHLQSLQRHRIPFVLLDREVPGIESDMVVGESKEGARQLVGHLIKLGHKRIALVNGSSTISTARQRFTGYWEALKLNDIPFDERLVMELGYKQLEDASQLDPLLQLEAPPTAIFAANNFLAVGIVAALRSKRIRVPDHMSIACFDDLGLASLLNPFLTVASQPAYQFGFLGTQLLVERIQQKLDSNWRKIILPSELIARESTRQLG
ncbi:LacI family DNA-binding transcriptional regulator [Paenibacillus koleovorans]|uniref:LacI family DNA-binding transcriptional regulator n=1 Tax=Paenibacillus koleovorans TaxID=121608 RepID=UPI000FD727A7|nr:LacI family DNA-binding transcriptional regulator [Paenibacillus koleovorans]